jgi:hypothetical protein
MLMNFQQACAEAARQARANPGCTIHVAARIEANGIEPMLDPSGYTVSDWYGDATVRSIRRNSDGSVQDTEYRFLPEVQP